MGITELVFGLSALCLGWLGFLEKRLHTMQVDIERHIEERNQLNDERNEVAKESQREIKEDLRRVELKIDSLLKMVYKGK